MKTDFLKSLGLEQEIIDKIMAENGRDIEATKGKYADYEAVKAQLAEAGKTIEGFKALDVEGIKAAADEWKAKYEQAEKDAAAKLADMEFSTLLETSITAAKGRNAKALKGLLDTEALKASKNQSEDIKAALAALRESDAYLFEDTTTPPPFAAGTGTAPAMGGYTKEAFGKMGYAERLTLKKERPEIYKTLKE